MKQYHTLTYLLILLLLTTGCQWINTKSVLFVVCYNGDVSSILALEDSYTNRLSSFDYAAKFGSDRPLSNYQLLKYWVSAIEPYTPDEIRKLKISFQRIEKALEGMELAYPETIHVFSEGLTEAGSSYSRGNGISIPKSFMNAISQDQLDRLVAHAFFHVLMRYNPALETDLYALIGYRKVAPLVLDNTLKALTISSPNTPADTYAITCHYEGTAYDFVPLTYSELPYDQVSGGTLYDYQLEGFLAVDTSGTTTAPLLFEGAPLIVTLDELSDFFDQVGQNTDYAHGPEDVTADHFVMSLFDPMEKHPNPELITAMVNRLKNGQ